MWYRESKLSKQDKKRLTSIKLKEGYLRILDGIAHTAFWNTGYSEIKRKTKELGIILGPVVDDGAYKWAPVLTACSDDVGCSGEVGTAECNAPIDNCNSCDTAIRNNYEV